MTLHGDDESAVHQPFRELQRLAARGSAQVGDPRADRRTEDPGHQLCGFVLDPRQILSNRGGPRRATRGDSQRLGYEPPRLGSHAFLLEPSGELGRARPREVGTQNGARRPVAGPEERIGLCPADPSHDSLDPPRGIGVEKGQRSDVALGGLAWK